MWGYKYHVSDLIICLFEIYPSAREIFLALTPSLSFAHVVHAYSAQWSTVQKQMSQYQPASTYINKSLLCSLV